MSLLGFLPVVATLFPAPDATGRLWGYIDASARFVIAPQYGGAEPFSEGLAFVVSRGRLVCIDENNRQQFELANPLPTGWIAPEGGFHDGHALVVVQGTGKGNRYTYVDRKGALLGPPRFWPARPFSGGLAAVAVDDRWGFLGPDGELAIPLGFAFAFDFGDGLAGVVRKRLVGYIDRKGHLVIPDRYEVASTFADGLAPVQPGSAARGDTTEMGYIDRAGRLAIPARFPHAYPFSEGRARVIVNMTGPQKWGFIDTAGALVVPARYAAAEDFHDGLAAVRVGMAWGYVDRDGREVIAPAYEWAGPFSGLARVRRRDGGGVREGYIDRAGKWVYAWDFDDTPR